MHRGYLRTIIKLVMLTLRSGWGKSGLELNINGERHANGHNSVE